MNIIITLTILVILYVFFKSDVSTQTKQQINLSDNMYTYKATILRVVDGDTLDVDIDLGFGVKIKERLRLKNVDTPETYGVKRTSEEYQAGVLAKNFVYDLCRKYNNECVVQTEQYKGKYGRYIADVQFADGTLLTEELINAGHSK